ncbi:MAG TPA: oligosaccharide flippase family protein [Polyangia bacterium]|nr:oligosaccharide flippase family protein [Polyangia bacterium]
MATAGIAARGAAWTIASSVLSRGLGLVGTLVLIRFVTPDDFGEVSAATIVVATINQLTTLGVGLYAVANKQVSREEMFHATLIHVTLGLLAVGIVTLLGKPLAPLFDTPDLSRYVPGMAISAFTDRVGFMPERVLIRELRFRRVSVVRSVSELAYTIVSVAGAAAGWGGQSIVAGNLVRSGVRAAGMVGSVKLGAWLGWVRPQLAILRRIASYGIAASLGSLAFVAGRRWDNLLVSRLFGPAVMGAYNLAYNLADIPAIQVGEQITDVLQASFTHMDVEDRRRTLLRSLPVIALVTFPIAVGLGAVAPTLADLFLNKKWAGTGSMLMILSALSIVRPMWGAISSYLIVERGPRITMVIEWLNLGVLMAAIATLGRRSPLWACGAVGIVFTARTVLGFWVARPETRVSTGAMLWRLMPPLAACLPLVAAVFGVRGGLMRLGVASPLVQLVAEVIAGGLAFVAAALVIARDPSRQVLAMIRKRKARTPEPTPAATPPLAPTA